MKQIIIKTGQVALIVFGVLLVQGALGASDNIAISFGECLIRCGIGMTMIVGAIWLPRCIRYLHRKTKNPDATAHLENQQKGA